MSPFETSWKTRDGLQLYAQGWQPATPPRAVACLVHGIGEHSGRYAHVADVLGKAGLAVLTFDLRGHGKSQGPRGHTPTFDAFMQDIDLLFAEADQRFAGLPRFLYGHSLGGVLVLNYALRRKPAVLGVVATSSGLRTSVEQQALKVAIAKGLGSIIPTLSLPTGLDVQGLSRDPEIIRKYQNDPLVHGVATLGMAKTTFQAIEWAFAHAAEFSLPLLLVHGTADPIAFARGSQEFAARVPKDCTLKLWEGLYHETHNEPEKEQVFAYLLEWLEARLAGQP
jgi:alpha-beta hydrolase superfamily lysophospholipase